MLATERVVLDAIITLFVELGDDGPRPDRPAHRGPGRRANYRPTAAAWGAVDSRALDDGPTRPSPSRGTRARVALSGGGGKGSYAPEWKP